MSSFVFLIIIVVIIVLWLDKGPLLLGLNGNLKGSVVVSLLVVTDQDSVPEVVHSDGAQKDIGVIQLVVVANPRSDESPEGLHGWVSTKSGCFLWLSAY